MRYADAIVARRSAWAHRLPFYYGWTIVALGAFSMFATTPGQSDSFSMFMGSFVSEFGWSRTFVSSLYSAATVLSGGMMFFAGRLVDRIGPRSVAVLSASVLGLACVLLSYVVSPAMLFVGFFLARLTGKGSLDLSAATVTPQWFISRRAFAIMLVGLGGAIGGAVFPVLNSHLILTFGWREAYRILAGGLWLLYVPVVFVFLVNRPEDIGMRPDNAPPSGFDERQRTIRDGATTPETDFHQSQAIRTRAFWIITFVVFQSSLVGTGAMIHFVSIFETSGFSMPFAARVMGIKPLVGLVSTIVAGLVLDRTRRLHVVLAFACMLQMVAFVLLACLGHPSIAYTHAVIGGVTAGVAGMCVGVLTPNLFGRRYLGGILGVIAALNVVGSAIGPVVLGAAFDSLGGYTEGIIGLSVLPLIAGVLSLFIRPPAVPTTR